MEQKVLNTIYNTMVFYSTHGNYLSVPKNHTIAASVASSTEPTELKTTTKSEKWKAISSKPPKKICKLF